MVGLLAADTLLAMSLCNGVLIKNHFHSWQSETACNLIRDVLCLCFRIYKVFFYLHIEVSLIILIVWSVYN